MESLDIDELCIVSSSLLSKTHVPKTAYKEQNIDDIGVKVLKAEGEKCSVCWKISKTSCEKHGHLTN